ncbi:MAG: hypothetical protein MUF72_16015 [Elainella sp. Prado103]|jgi:hypothetical protein|nr:hypothetical protein [Elainella sp. Prado103]
MNNVCSIDFHQGWFIEVQPALQGFQAVAYSPCRERCITPDVYPTEWDALYAAKQQINFRAACGSIAKTLQEFYQAGQITSEDWHSLKHSLQ